MLIDISENLTTRRIILRAADFSEILSVDLNLMLFWWMIVIEMHDEMLKD